MATDVGLIEIVIGRGSMQALARINPDGDPDSYGEDKLLSTLAGQSIQITEDVRDRVRLLVERLQRGDFPNEDVTLVEGTLPAPGKDGYVEWSPECDPANRAAPSEGDTVDHYARTSIISVSEGDLVCRVFPPIQGTPGTDVYGREVMPPKARRTSVEFGEGIAPHGDDGRMLATTGGKLCFAGDRVWISPLLRVNRNVDFQVGNIDFDGDVLIHGNILDLFQVKCTKNLVVRGMIEAAQIECKGDLVVTGGIAGKEKAVITVGGQVAARFVDNATVVAGRDILAQKELVNCTVVCQQSVLTKGAITACNVEASGGIEAAVIGSRSGIRTTLMVGSTAEVFRRLAKIDRELMQLEERIDRLRGQLEPLLQRQQSLPKIQQGMVARLLKDTKEAMTRLEVLKKERQGINETIKSHRGACIKVSRLIHEGTTVQIGKAAATLRDTLRGPLRLVSHAVDGAARVAACSDQGGLVLLESYQ